MILHMTMPFLLITVSFGALCDALKVDRVLSVSYMALLLELQIAAARCRIHPKGVYDVILPWGVAPGEGVTVKFEAKFIDKSTCIS